jgi:hypothetical protein
MALETEVHRVKRVSKKNAQTRTVESDRDQEKTG